MKESYPQGLKEQLAVTVGEKAEELRQEIGDLEDRIDEPTSFRTEPRFTNRWPSQGCFDRRLSHAEEVVNMGRTARQGSVQVIL